MYEYKNIKIFLQKVTFEIGLKNLFWLKILKILCCEPMLLVILTEKKLLERFAKRIAKNKLKRV